MAGVELPKIVSKYRDWNNPHHRKILTVPEIYFAGHKSFHESSECSLPWDYDSLTENLLHEYCRYTAKLDGVKETEMEVEAAKLYKRIKIRDPNHRIEAESQFQVELDRTLSIFCATEERDNLNLWNKFGAERTGFCVGIDTEFLIGSSGNAGGCGPVIYYPPDSIPMVPAITFSSDQRIQKMTSIILNLPDKFQEEKEFRFTRMHIPNRKVKLPKEAIKEIILGDKMTDADKNKIKEITQKKLPSAKLFQAHYYDLAEMISVVEL